MDCQKTIFSGHAIRRMFEREISKPEVASIIATGKVIAEYPDDTPFPSFLLCGLFAGRPLHVVVAVDKSSDSCYVVTAYVPSPEQ